MKKLKSRVAELQRLTEKELAQRRRYERLSQPIDADRVLEFTRHLVAIRSRSGDECWIHVPFRRGKDFPELFTVGLVGYSNASWNGESVPAHRFAYCVEHGITPSQITGLHIHHMDMCVGTRCQRPTHLEEKEAPKHQGMHRKGVPKDEPTLNAKHIRMFHEVMQLPKAERLLETEDATRYLSDIPFQIRFREWHQYPDPTRCWEVPPNLEVFLKRNGWGKVVDNA